MYNGRHIATDILTTLGLTVYQDVPGKYDPSVDGYIIFWDVAKDEYYRVNFTEDSMGGGDYENICKVTPTTETVTVWE